VLSPLFLSKQRWRWTTRRGAFRPDNREVYLSLKYGYGTVVSSVMWLFR